MMAIDEPTRHELHQRLDAVLGADEAATLMAHLPPTGWGDVVTREYLDLTIRAQDARLDARFTQIDARFTQIDARFTQIDAHIAQIDAHIAQIDAHIAQIDGRFDTSATAVDGRFERLEQRIDALRDEVLAAVRGELIAALSQQTRQMILAMIGTVLSLAALARFL